MHVVWPLLLADRWRHYKMTIFKCGQISGFSPRTGDRVYRSKWSLRWKSRPQVCSCTPNFPLIIPGCGYGTP